MKNTLGGVPNKLGKMVAMSSLVLGLVGVMNDRVAGASSLSNVHTPMSVRTLGAKADFSGAVWNADTFLDRVKEEIKRLKQEVMGLDFDPLLAAVEKSFVSSSFSSDLLEE